MKTWEDVYELPLKCSNEGIRVTDNKNNFVFQFLKRNNDLITTILAIINGTSTIKVKDTLIYDGEYIREKEENIPLLMIRGWENLTGTGAMNLPHKEAMNIQDTFAEFIISKLTKK